MIYVNEHNYNLQQKLFWCYAEEEESVCDVVGLAAHREHCVTGIKVYLVWQVLKCWRIKKKKNWIRGTADELALPPAQRLVVVDWCLSLDPGVGGR